MARGVLLLVCLLILAGAVSASEYKTDFYIEYDKVLVDTIIVLDPTTDKIEFRLPLDASAITLEVDDVEIDPVLDGNILIVELNDNQKIRYQYITEVYLEDGAFLANIRPAIDTDKLAVHVSLPDRAVLESAVDDDLPSVMPAPNDIKTNGRVIDLYWERHGVDDLSVMVRYVVPLRVSKALIVAIPIGIILGFLAVLLSRRLSATSGGPRNGSHLKEDEEQVVSILEKRDGQVEQGTLRVITGFSKAKLSGLLSEMEDRKVIHREKRGKKNLVFLK